MQNLTKNILIGFILGLSFGILLNIIDFDVFYKNSLINYLSIGGEIFLKIIKMLVVPIVFFSLTSGVANLYELSTLGKIGVKSILLYLTTTFFSITLSLLFAHYLIPGENFNLKIESGNVEIFDAPSLSVVFLICD